MRIRVWSVNGDASDAVHKIAMQAIADLEQHWGEQFPKLYQKDFEPISGHRAVPSGYSTDVR
jgi:hypothetical protein